MENDSPPNYKNLSPEERERWKIYLAQKLGKPKGDISRDNWEELRQGWKIPSLVSAAQDGGMRAALIGRLTTDLVDLNAGQIAVPPEVAVKNDSSWQIELSNKSITLLEKWLEQRANKPKYDSSQKIWLNRNSNPYNSYTLNHLLSNLIEEAGIDQGERKLTWHSIRHSTGMYVYDEERDLALVAEILRHESLESAKQYAHPTPELKKDVVSSINGGDFDE